MHKTNKSFVKTSFVTEIQERTKQLSLKKKNQERAKPVTTPSTSILAASTTIKRKTPPSGDTEDKNTDVAKRLHFSEQSPVEEETMKPDETIQEEQTKEDRILLKLETLQQSINDLQNDWKLHKDELQNLRYANSVLKKKLTHLEQTNKGLSSRMKSIEDKLLEHNVIFQGISESTWESEEVLTEKVINIIAVLVNMENHADQLASARNIPIDSVKRIGKYNSLKTRPVSVRFGCIGDVEYLLLNRRRLAKGVFVEQEYGPETTHNQKVLKPILNAARRLDKYKGKCQLDADVLLIHGKEYTVDTIHTLPDDINGFQVSSRSDGKTFAFFGELNLLSNFYPCNFEHNGIPYHSSEQMIQYTKATFFNDHRTANAILNAGSALECKMLARDVKGYNREEWNKATGELCIGGLTSKIEQNDDISNVLMGTENLTIVEASRDQNWGCGLSLYNECCLYPQTWYSQGLLGTLLEEIRRNLFYQMNIKGSNTESTEPTETAMIS